MLRIYGTDRREFYQWDLNQKLLIEEPTVDEVHFCNGTSDTALVTEVYTYNGVRVANVPNAYLEDTKPIKAYAYCEQCFTKEMAIFNVIARTKPSDYVYEETEIKRWDGLEAEIDAIKADYVKKADPRVTGPIYTSASTPYLIGTASKVGVRAVNSSGKNVGQFAISDSLWDTYEGQFANVQVLGNDDKYYSLKVSKKGPTFTGADDIEHKLAFKDSTIETIQMQSMYETGIYGVRKVIRNLFDSGKLSAKRYYLVEAISGNGAILYFVKGNSTYSNNYIFAVTDLTYLEFYEIYGEGAGYNPDNLPDNAEDLKGVKHYSMLDMDSKIEALYQDIDYKDGAPILELSSGILSAVHTPISDEGVLKYKLIPVLDEATGELTFN